ncbi:right-handed parallel beta-helix repeat-containing protein, partial [Escherichia coli]
LSGINADGFAAKLGVGPGNIFRGCIAHNNADDGWDLFNKIEDGPNASVTIENSVAYENGLPYNKADILKGSIGNGFKLGGEGQPVNHKVINSIAINNNMDGFTDNFNTGSL